MRLQYDDETLVYMTLSGEQRAYEELVLRYQSAVLASASSVLRSVYLAEDAAQDAFIAAWMKLDSLKEPSKFGGWVCRIAKNRAKNMALRYRPWIDIGTVENTVEDDDPRVSPENVTIMKEEKEELHKALTTLPEKVRNVIYLHYFEGLSVAEIAVKTAEPVGTVKWQLCDGRKRLRGELIAMNENTNDTLVIRVMKKVEELKLWAARSDKKDFDLAYNDVLSDVEALPETEEKYHAMADVLLRGFWWIKGKKNDETLARIKEAAERGHNDEATSFLYAKEDEKLSGDAKIEFIRDKQIPSLEGKDFPLTLGVEWYNLGLEYFSKNEREQGFAAYEKAAEILPKDSVNRALVLAATEAEREFDKKYTDKETHKYCLGAGAYEFVTDKEDFTLLSSLFSRHRPFSNRVVGFNKFICFFACCYCDGRFAADGKKPGYVYEGTDGTTLTFVSDNETVKTPAGTFDFCELWAIKPASYHQPETYLTYYKRGVGIVKHTRRVIDEEETVVLSAYNVGKSDRLLPLDLGSEWKYERQSETPSVNHDIRIKVINRNEKRAVVSMTEYTERLYYDENCFSDMAYAVRSEYFSNDDGIVHDVRGYVDNLIKSAKTKAEKVHAKSAADVMRRIMDETEVTKDRAYDNAWNFFEYGTLKNRNGDIIQYENRDFAFELKCIGRDCKPLLFNGIYGILQYNTGCLWSEQWVDGYTVSKEVNVIGAEPVKLTLYAEKCGEVETPCGKFGDCMKIIIETDGFKDGFSYIGGKKTYTFAYGVGIIKSENRYLEGGKTVVYELTEYDGKGDGYFPYEDGFRRKYELKKNEDNENLAACAEYEYVKDGGGDIAVFTSKRGSRKISNPGRYYESSDENQAMKLWEERKFDEYYAKQGLVNLNVQLHALLDAAPINMYNGRMPAAFNQFAMRLMESFGEDGVLPGIWYGLYAHKCLIASAALFSMGENEKAIKHLDTAFTYFEKWAEIPKGTKLPLGAPWLFGSIKAKKGSNLLIMPDGTKEELYENDVFKERPFCDVAGYLKTWGWFDPVKNEPFFLDYIKRAEEYKVK